MIFMNIIKKGGKAPPPGTKYHISHSQGYIVASDNQKNTKYYGGGGCFYNLQYSYCTYIMYVLIEYLQMQYNSNDVM